MLTSPFDNSNTKVKNRNKKDFQECDVVFVSDIFSDEYIGGAELTTDNIINKHPNNTKVYRLKSNELTIEYIQNGVGKYWVFCNFSGMNLELVPTIVANLFYSIVEYDYKFCKYRSYEKHAVIENKPCDCAEQMQGKIISAFFHGADNIFWMSYKQQQVYVRHFPFIEGGNNHILSSVFSDETLDALKEMRSTNIDREDKCIIVGSTSWIKGTQEAEKYCNENNLEFENVWNISHNEMLEKFASSKSFIFLPLGGDTCPRTVIEAKLAGCELILNDNVQHKDEDWFDTTPANVDNYLRTAGNRFWSKIEDSIHREDTISGYTTTKDCISQTYPFVQSIKSMLGFCDQVVIVDGGSTDGTWEKLQELAKSDKRITIDRNERDWSHERFAVFDGLQKAYARSLCIGDWCWQQDSDEVVHEDDYDKVKQLIKKMPKSLELMALPIIEYWGGNDKVRVDVNPWKWRLSRNRNHITHGIPNPLRKIDENGCLYASPGTDGCDYIDNDTYEVIPCANFYTKGVHDVRDAALRGNEEALKAYEGWLYQVIEKLPGVHHYSWFDLERKIKTYKNYWSQHWQSLYNIEQLDTVENNMFFDKSWKDVSDSDIQHLAAKLSEEMGGWIFHEKIDFNKPTPHITINRNEPEEMLND
jgi:glycosyltransferase involved in cell wall biosynthesis